jgi:hypothetical protein
VASISRKEVGDSEGKEQMEVELAARLHRTIVSRVNDRPVDVKGDGPHI